MKNKNRRPIAFASLLAGLLLVCSQADAQEISEVLGDYEVFLTNNAAKHESARLLVLRSAKVGTYETFGLAFVTNNGSGSGGQKGDGLVCEEAFLLLDRTVLTCTKAFRNPNGHVIGEETLTVGVTGSAYCAALKQRLPVADQNKIADKTNTSCDESTEQCVCYDLKSRGNTDFGPPSSGSGSGRR